MIRMMYLIGSLFEVFVTIYFLDKMLTRRMNKWVTAGILILFSIVNDLVTKDKMSQEFRVIMAIVMVVCFILVMYKDSLKKKMIVLGFQQITGILAECLANVILINTMDISDDSVYFILGYVETKIIYFIIIRVILLLYRNNNDIQMNYRSFLSIMVIPLLSIVLLVFIIYIKKDLTFGVYDLVIYTSVLVINYITVIQYDNLQRMVYLDNKNKVLEKQNMYYVHYNQETKEMWEKIRSLKHNMKNEYITQRILLQDKEYDKLIKRYDSVISEIEEDKNMANSGNVYIDAVINYKSMEIRDIGGEMECFMAVKEGLNIQEEDMVIILGNLLDNIKDALDEEGLREKWCRLLLVYDEPNLIIETENPYIGERIKNHRNEYVTTKKDKDIHGIGIKAIQRTVEKYNGKMSVEDDNDIFKVSIILQL